MNKKQIEFCKKIYNKTNSDYKKTKVMCFLFKGKKLLSYGVNSNKTDPIQTKFGEIYRRKINYNSNIFYLDKRHAEVDCLKKFIENKEMNFSNLTIFILSIHKDGITYRNSKPCPICREFLDSIKIGEICYFMNNRFVSEKII